MVKKMRTDTTSYSLLMEQVDGYLQFDYRNWYQGRKSSLLCCLHGQVLFNCQGVAKKGHTLSLKWLHLASKTVIDSSKQQWLSGVVGSVYIMLKKGYSWWIFQTFNASQLHWSNKRLMIRLKDTLSTRSIFIQGPLKQHNKNLIFNDSANLWLRWMTIFSHMNVILWDTGFLISNIVNMHTYAIGNHLFAMTYHEKWIIARTITFRYI